MAKFVQLMNTKSDGERYRLMLFFMKTSVHKDNAHNFNQSQHS